MNLYLISQSENVGYDTYDSAVVAAENEDEARNIHPNTPISNLSPWETSVWCSHPSLVHVDFLGTAKLGTRSGVVLASFNAG